MLYFVGVGPGDPELVTLKAARIIAAADMIALPEGGAAARAAGDLISGKVIMPLRLPMTEEPEALKAAHAAAAEPGRRQFEAPAALGHQHVAALDHLVAASADFAGVLQVAACAPQGSAVGRRLVELA